MEGAAFLAIILLGLCAMALVGAVLTHTKPRKPMARYARTDILPPPSSQCERVAYREHA